MVDMPEMEELQYYDAGNARSGSAGGPEGSAGRAGRAGGRATTPGGRRLLAAMGIAVIVLLVLASLLANAVFGTRMVNALLVVEQKDVFVRDAKPYGDNLTALVPVEVEIMNIGDGRSGEITVWAGAFSNDQTNLLKSDFNTSILYKMGDARAVFTIAEKDRPGSIVRARGELRLPPGAYEIRLRVYEDAGRRTLLSGSVDIIVNGSMVSIQEPYKSQGRSPGRSYPAPSAALQGGATPGFGGVEMLGAGGLAMAGLFVARGKLRKINKDFKP